MNVGLQTSLSEFTHYSKPELSKLVLCSGKSFTVGAGDSGLVSSAMEVHWSVFGLVNLLIQLL